MNLTDKLLQVSDKKFYSKSSSDLSKPFSADDIRQIDGDKFLEIPLVSTISYMKVFDVNQENQIEVTDLTYSPVTYIKLNNIFTLDNESSDESSGEQESSTQSDEEIVLDFSGKYLVGDETVYFTPDDLLKIEDEYLLRTKTNQFVSKLYILNGIIPAHNTVDVSSVTKKILININNIDTQDIINGGKIVSDGVEVNITYNANIFTMNDMNYLMLDYSQKDYDCYFYDNNNELIQYELNHEADKLAIIYNSTTMSFNSEYGVYIDDGILRQVIKETTNIKGTNYFLFNDVENFNNRLYILQESGGNSFTEYFLTKENNKTFVDISKSSFDFSNGGMIYLGFALDNDINKWIVRKMYVYKNFSNEQNDFQDVDYSPCLAKIQLFAQNAKDYSNDYYNVNYVTNVRRGLYWREPTKNLVSEYEYLDDGNIYTPTGAIKKAHELYGYVFHITGSYYDQEAKEWKLNNYRSEECQIGTFGGGNCYLFRVEQYGFCKENNSLSMQKSRQILSVIPNDGIIVNSQNEYRVEKIMLSNGIWVINIIKNNDSTISENGKVYILEKSGKCKDLLYEIGVSSEQSSESSLEEWYSQIVENICISEIEPYWIDPDPPIDIVPPDNINPIPDEPYIIGPVPPGNYPVDTTKFAIVQTTKMCEDGSLVSKYQLVDLNIKSYIGFNPRDYYEDNTKSLVKIKQPDGSYNFYADEPFTKNLVSVFNVPVDQKQAFMNYYEDNFNTDFPECKKKQPNPGCQSFYVGTTNSSKQNSDTISLSGFGNAYHFMKSGNKSGYDDAMGNNSRVSYSGCTWRFYEKGYNLTYNTGTVAEDGTLTGLPSSFTSYNGYDGNMYIQICCK